MESAGWWMQRIADNLAENWRNVPEPLLNRRCARVHLLNFFARLLVPAILWRLCAKNRLRTKCGEHGARRHCAGALPACEWKLSRFTRRARAAADISWKKFRTTSSMDSRCIIAALRLDNLFCIPSAGMKRMTGELSWLQKRFSSPRRMEGGH